MPDTNPDTNPYSPSVATPAGKNTRSLPCQCMFWLCAIMAIVVGGIAVFGGYQNFTFASLNGGRIPPYIIAVTVLMVVCSISLFVAASFWRARRVRDGAWSLVAAVLLFFGGPWLLLMLLA